MTRKKKQTVLSSKNIVESENEITIKSKNKKNEPLNLKQVNKLINNLNDNKLIDNQENEKLNNKKTKSPFESTESKSTEIKLTNDELSKLNDKSIKLINNFDDKLNSPSIEENQLVQYNDLSDFSLTINGNKHKLIDLANDIINLKEILSETTSLKEQYNDLESRLINLEKNKLQNAKLIDGDKLVEFLPGSNHFVSSKLLYSLTKKKKSNPRKLFNNIISSICSIPDIYR